MKKINTLVLALLASISLCSQSVINFTSCSTPNLNNSLEITADTNNYIYISYPVTNNDYATAKSTDNGNNFTQIAAGNPGNFIALGNPNSVVLFSNTVSSIDGGLTWQSHSLFDANTTGNVFLKLNNKTAYFFGTSKSYKTTNGGLSWLLVPSPPVNISGNSYFGNTYYLGNNETYFTYAGAVSNTSFLINSNDFGSTFSYSLAVNSSNMFYAVLPNPYNAATFFAFTANGLIKEYPLNTTNLNNNTSSISYSILNNPNTNAKFGRGIRVNNFYYVIDNDNSSTASNGILKTSISSILQSIDELSKLTVSVYPNPCIDNITINGLDKEYNYIINNQLGQNVLQGSTRQQINTSTLMPGIYFLNIANQKVIKFIKE